MIQSRSKSHFYIDHIKRNWTIVYLEGRLLEVHDGIRDLDTDWLDGHLHIEWSSESL